MKALAGEKLPINFMNGGINMANCAKCGVEVVATEDLYEDQGLQICEDCKIKSTFSPSQPCGVKESTL
jgi:hypothetical protein